VRPQPTAGLPTDAAASATRVVLTVLAPFAAGYFLSYLFRSVNAVVGPRLVAEVGLSAGGLGLLTAAYLLAFAAFQLPLGVLLDRFGPRRVQTALLACAALGSLLFALAGSIVTLIPVVEEGEEDVAAGVEPQTFEHGEIAGDADGEGWEDDVKRDGESELQPGEGEGVELHDFGLLLG
jgi:hypothetical protein